MDTPVPAAPLPEAERQTLLEERDWREKEERIKEVTYDQERIQADQGIRHMQADLSGLEAYPLQKLVGAGVLGEDKAASLAVEGVATIGSLVRWVGERTD